MSWAPSSLMLANVSSYSVFLPLDPILAPHTGNQSTALQNSWLQRYLMMASSKIKAQTTPKQTQLLKSQKIKFTHATWDSHHSGVLWSDGSMKPTPHHFFVDDKAYVDLNDSYQIQIIAGSIETI